jgi:hypothetical protein
MKLAEERDQLAPFMGLAQRIQSDPVFASTIAAYLQGQAPPQARQQVKPQPQFADPIEQLKWETKQEAIAELRQEMQQHLQPMQRLQVLNSVKAEIQRDPDYGKVHQAIVDMVASQPPLLQKSLYLQLDQDPQSYMEAFQYHKQRLLSSGEQQQEAPPEPPKTPVKKQTKAPILDGGGVAPPTDTATKEKQVRLSKQKANALRSGDPMAIADWLQSSGAIDHLY